MKTLRILKDGKTLIAGFGREMQKGDTIDLPDDIADDMLKDSRRYFEEVTEKTVLTDIIDIPKKRKGGK